MSHEVNTQGSTGADAPALVAAGVTKTYPGVTALHGVSLRLAPGSVHALVGENGAGKSTLVKVITGAVAPDEAEIVVGGVVVSALTPRTAAALGIAVIPQERQIAFDLSVAENVLLGRLPRTPYGAVDSRLARDRAAELCRTVGVDVDVRRPVRGLGAAQLQGLEIARALALDARIVLMDEPTSALSAAEVERLFASIRALRAAGKAVLYISHHLEEIFEIADEVTVLRDGRVVVTRPVAGLDAHNLTALMIGREPEELEARVVPQEAAGAEREVSLEAIDVHRAPALRGVSLRALRGEILCVTGAVGSGRRELARCLVGVERPDQGIVLVEGRPVAGPRDAIRHGVVFVPEDRKREGLLLELTVSDNVALGRLVVERSPLARPWRFRREAAQVVEQLHVRTPSVSTPVRLLSGGNQQKVVLGRWLNVGARTLVFDEPTAGIDVGAKVEIYRLLRDLADGGAAIVLFSSDFEEIKIMADRVIVVRRGTIAGEIPRDEISEERLLALQLAAA
jgi:ABC-type sugar transport system ATPase subunit